MEENKKAPTWLSAEALADDCRRRRGIDSLQGTQAPAGCQAIKNPATPDKDHGGLLSGSSRFLASYHNVLPSFIRFLGYNKKNICRIIP
jgi:hypothetical protein